jgi:phage-related protein
MRGPKPIAFLGDSLKDLREFPAEARREAGYQLDRVQNGLEPERWKPIKTVGQGVSEITVTDAAGEFRVIYVARFATAIFVLHCFHKTTRRTSKPDLTLAATRYRELTKELKR